MTDKNFSCIPKEPLIKLDENGQSPIIKYSMPHRTSFTAKSFLPLDIKEKCFKAKEREQRIDDWWHAVKSMSHSDLVAQLNSDIATSSLTSGIINNASLSSKVFFEKPDLSHEPQLSETVGTTSKKRVVSKEVSSFKVGGISSEMIAEQIKTHNRVPYLKKDFYGTTQLVFRPVYKKLDPQIYLIEEYEVVSILGDYGAGRIIETINFGPGEERTITVKNFKSIEVKKEFSQNILDTFSQESSNEFERLFEDESTSKLSDSTEAIKSKEASANVSGGFGPVSAGVSGGLSNKESSSSAREEIVRQLSRTMDKHVEKSSANREIRINSSTTSTFVETDEEATTRVIKNPNFKTMNLVMRQMEQEYITIIYLKNVEIGYSNGDPNSVRKVKLHDTDSLLESVLEEDCVDGVRCSIISQLLSIRDLNGDTHRFIECFEESYFECNCDVDKKPKVKFTNKYWRKRRDLIQTLTQFRKDLNNHLEVNGIIMDIQVRPLRTEGVVADVFLGHGEALDCFNQRLQDEAVNAESLKNRENQTKLDILDQIIDPKDKVDAFVKLFPHCCENGAESNSKK